MAHMGRTGELELPPGYRRLAKRYRALCRKDRVLAERYGADVTDEEGALGLAFLAIRRSNVGIALLRDGSFLVRNVRWLALERRRGDDWHGGDRAYPNLRALAIGEASAMARAGERARELRFARLDVSQAIEVRLEQFDRRGRSVYLVMARDVTEVAQVEQRRERCRSEAAEQERLRSVGELASATAHELNNVLHAMALRLASLRGQPEEAGREASLGALARMVSQAAACVSGLQDVGGRSCAAQGSVHPRKAPPSGLELPRLRVLVVDDDPDVLEATGLALAHLEQHVDVTPSGVEAVARFMAGERFDLVLCDIGMPELDGWQVAREVRALAPDTRLYLISGWAREIRADEVRRAGVAGLLAKPLSLEALRSLLAGAPVSSKRPDSTMSVRAPEHEAGGK